MNVYIFAETNKKKRTETAFGAKRYLPNESQLKKKKRPRTSLKINAAFDILIQMYQISFFITFFATRVISPHSV